MSSPARTGQLPQTRLSSSKPKGTGSILIPFWYKPESAVTKPMNQVNENTQGHCTEGLQQKIWRNLPYKRISSHLSSELESNWCPEATSLTLLPETLPGKAIPSLSLWYFNHAYLSDFSDPCGHLPAQDILQCYDSTFETPFQWEVPNTYSLHHSLCEDHIYSFGLTHLPIQQHRGTGQNWACILVWNHLSSPLMQDKLSPAS